MKRQALLFAALLTATTITAQMPVLRVTFGGNITTDTDYHFGQMVLTDADGSVTVLPAKFKSRGATAKQYSMKPSFNMKLRDADGTEIDSTLCGLRSASSWILDAMAIDRIGMRNRVAFDIWNEFSRLPYDTQFDSRNGTVGQFVEVYINDTYKGIYCLTDRINRKLLDLKKPQVTEGDSAAVVIRGVLYKHGTNSVGDQNTAGTYSPDSTALVIRYHDAWELTEPEDYAGMAAWQPLYELYENKDSFEYVRDHFYMDNLAEYQVFIAALSIGDNWGNKNAYISARNIQADGNKRRFVYTPWDLDTSLGGKYNGSNYGGTYSNWKVSDVMKASSKPIPFSVCNRQNEFKDLLREKWIQGRLGALSVESVSQKLYAYRDLFISTGAWQRACDYWNSQHYRPCYVSDLTTEIDYIVEWYKKRHAEMDEYFGIDPLGIEQVCPPTQPARSAVYNLQGMKVTKPTRGLYIQNGTKFLVR